MTMNKPNISVLKEIKILHKAFAQEMDNAALKGH